MLNLAAVFSNVDGFSFVILGTVITVMFTFSFFLSAYIYKRSNNHFTHLKCSFLFVTLCEKPACLSLHFAISHVASVSE